MKEKKDRASDECVNGEEDRCKREREEKKGARAIDGGGGVVCKYDSQREGKMRDCAWEAN